MNMNPLSIETLHFQVISNGASRKYRARVSVDVTVDGTRFGQQAEALISTYGI